jgi:hypothetical protein
MAQPSTAAKTVPPARAAPEGINGGPLSGISDSDRQAIEAIVTSAASGTVSQQPDDQDNDGDDDAGNSQSAQAVGGSERDLSTALFRGGAPLKFSDREAVDLAIRRELDFNFSDASAIDANEIKLMQQQFVRNFPFSRYEGRLSSEEVMRIKGLTLSASVAEILQSLLRFLSYVYIRPFASTARYSPGGASTDELFLAVYRQLLLFSSDTMKRSASGASSAAASSAEMSIFLLCVRVVVDAWFTVRMPGFADCPTGRSVLHCMDNIVMALVDPMGMLSHISVVESTPAALKLMRSRKLPEKLHSAVTSPLVMFIIGESAGSHEVKKFAQQKPPCVEAGLKELRRHLTPFVRSQLLRTITEEKLRGH